MFIKYTLRLQEGLEHATDLYYFEFVELPRLALNIVALTYNTTEKLELSLGDLHVLNTTTARA